MTKSTFRAITLAAGLIGSIAAADSDSEDTTTTQTNAIFDIETGQSLYKKQCRGCHGPTAKGLASYPKLRDQTPDYLIDKLERYRAGEKFGPNTPLMAPRAKKLSDEDIVNISYFIASIE